MNVATRRRISRSVIGRLPHLERDEQLLDWGPCFYRGDHAINYQQSWLAGDWFLTTKRFWFITPASCVGLRHERIRDVETHQRWPWPRSIAITAERLDGTTAQHHIYPRRSLGNRLRRALRHHRQSETEHSST